MDLVLAFVGAVIFSLLVVGIKFEGRSLKPDSEEAEEDGLPADMRAYQSYGDQSNKGYRE
ncbi:MAG: hypothetical protein WCX71_05780 [Candidatus Buchananbacteria bacterium]